MAPLSVEQVAEELSQPQQTGHGYSECRSRAIMACVGTGFIGFSGGYGSQVLLRPVLPSFIKRYLIIPALLAVYASSRTHEYLVTNCTKKFRKNIVIQTDRDKQEDRIALS